MIEALRFLKKNLYSSKSELKNNYSKIGKPCAGNVIAVDGGCCIIADGGSWIISKIKVASVHYEDGKRVPEKERKEEVYYTVIKKDEGFKHSLSFKPDFKNIRELTEAPAIIMRTLEFKHALELIKTLPKNSILLIDGLLTGETEEQERTINSLETESKKNGINIIGFAKTFRHSLNGRSTIGSLIKEKPEEKWCYSPVEGSDCFIVKLHERAKYAYALNTFKHVKVRELLPVLSYYSTDPSFLGYPYPLLRVDKEARISSHEKHLEMNKLKIISKREGLDFIEYDEKSTSMHSIMDSQKYR